MTVRTNLPRPVLAPMDDAMRQRAEDVFWNSVMPAGECLLWTKQITWRGYGRLTVAGRPLAAHRLSYELFVGPIPAGMVLDHLCRNRACVCPGHLEPVSDRTNILRGVGITADLAARTTCPKGHPLVRTNTQRRCVVCGRAINREYAARRTAEAKRLGISVRQFKLAHISLRGIEDART